MKKISIDELIDMADSRYSLVTIISKRARQIIDGQDALIRTDTLKPVCVAIEEFYDNKFDAIYDEKAYQEDGEYAETEEEADTADTEVIESKEEDTDTENDSDN